MRFLSLSTLLMLSMPVFAAEPLKTTRDEVSELKAELALLKARVDAAESFAARLGYRPASTATPMPTTAVSVSHSQVQYRTGPLGLVRWRVAGQSCSTCVTCSPASCAAGGCANGVCPAK